MKEWLKIYLMYMRVGAYAIPFGLGSALYAAKFGDSKAVVLVSLMGAFICALVCESHRQMEAGK